ncbi:MAG TPA: NAD(P)/FAD-dependent oxidoreductase, partial [Candidatus Limnocylindria bacterium]|nr:NAD(P)/FAD-dependent oxidoreductase [Candidatus Limnocylindria bacterium]
MSIDAAIIGSGPNGLAAAIELARAGRSVRVHEAEPTIGGGTRSAALTLPGFLHDLCSAIHPLGAGSPYFRTLPLKEHGLEWVHPGAPLAHPLDDGTAAVLHRSLDETVRGLGADGGAYRRLFGSLVPRWEDLIGETMRPMLHIPRHPFLLARFGVPAMLPVTTTARLFSTPNARALLAGLGAHSFLPLDAPFTTAFALMLGISAHAVGWPMPRGGSQKIADALASYLRALGGEIRTGDRIDVWAQLGKARAYVFDTTPRAVERIAGDKLNTTYRRVLRGYRYGPGVFKVDYALAGPVPWRAEACRRAGTVHLGGTLEEIAAGEKQVARGEHPERPFVLVAQQSLFDPTRAPLGMHTLWTYCHVPSGSTVDMTARIEAQLERFAPGFRDLVLKRSVMNTRDIESHNANYI